MIERKIMRAFAAGVLGTLLVLYAPALLSAMLDHFLPRPSVSIDWVKARCYEYIASGQHPKGWRPVRHRSVVL